MLASRMKPLRVACTGRGSHSIDEGWTRWILEQNSFPSPTCTTPIFVAAHLREHYDVS